MPIAAGHLHRTSLDAPKGLVLFFFNDHGQSFTFLGKTWYKCDGTNGTTNLMGRFLRFNTSTNQGGQDNFTITENNLPEYDPLNGIADGQVLMKDSSSPTHEVANPNTNGDFMAINKYGVPTPASIDNRPLFQELIPYMVVD